MSSILWFRRDLRLDDHPALLAAAHAAEGSDGVVPVFVLDDRLLASAGTPRVAYLLDSLRALDESLGGRLNVLRGDPRIVVPDLARDVGAETVHVSADYSPFGRKRDVAVEEALEASGVHLVRTGSPYAIGPGTLQTGSGTPYRVFTPFRKAWLAHAWRSPASWPDGGVAWVPPAPGLGVTALPPVPDLGPMRLPQAGEQHARRRWADFRDGALADYDWGRDRPDLPGTSWASPALKYGEIHPRTLLAELEPALHDERRASAETYRSELAWREFHADVLFHLPWSATRSMRDVVPEDAWATGQVEADRLDAWANGKTGYPMVDAGMRQLLAEGWVHNRVRMIVASFLIKDLHVRWQRGAEHFMRFLVDGDVASNQQNWQWVAGTGTDAAPYFRVFNPVSQGIKFDPEGAYVRRYVAELSGVSGKAVHEPWKLPGGLPAGYPERIVDHAVERQQSLADYGRRPGAAPRSDG